MRKIVISRTPESNNRLRDYKIFLNDKYHGVLLPNEKNKIIIYESGKNLDYIQFKIDWCSSNKIRIPISAGLYENKIEVGSSFPNKLMAIFLLGFVVCLSLFLLLNNIVFGLIAIAIILVPIYKISIGRRNFLIVKEVIDN